MRTTVRRDSAMEEIQSAPTAREFLDDLEIIVISDMTRDDAFLQALQGVTYVLHSTADFSPSRVILQPASRPMSQTDSPDKEYAIAAAVHGSTRLLKSALKVPNIKHIIITSAIDIVLGDSEIELFNGNPFFHPRLYLVIDCLIAVV